MFPLSVFLLIPFKSLIFCYLPLAALCLVLPPVFSVVSSGNEDCRKTPGFGLHSIKPPIYGAQVPWLPQVYGEGMIRQLHKPRASGSVGHIYLFSSPINIKLFHSSPSNRVTYF